MQKEIDKGLPETERMPVLFIGHGSPLNIILNNSYADSLVHLGKAFQSPGPYWSFQHTGLQMEHMSHAMKKQD